MKINMDDDLKEYVIMFGVIVAPVVASIFALIGITSLNNTIEDSIKYNRYTEVLQEYKKCAKEFPDSFDVRTYCGDPPSSTMML